MRRIATLLAVSVGLVVALPAAPASATPAEVKMFKKINRARDAHGVPKLRGSWSLLGSATRYANRMMSWDYFGHQARIPVASRWSAAGETLAWHRGWRPNPGRTVRMWLRSPTHRAVLLSSRYRKIGVGKSRGYYAGSRATMWVAHVARR